MLKKPKNELYWFNQKDYIAEKDNNIAIKRGCSNKNCFCTGKCNEIIGFRDKTKFEL